MLSKTALLADRHGNLLVIMTVLRHARTQGGAIALIDSSDRLSVVEVNRNAAARLNAEPGAAVLVEIQ